MRIDETVEIAAPAEAVWAFLADPERVAAALPGAEITERIGDNAYKGGMSVKVGPLAASYTGTVSFDLNEAERSAVVRASGQGKAGMGNAEMTMRSAVEALARDRTRVAVSATLVVTGILAQLGRGMIQHVSKKMFKDFAQIVARQVAGDARAAGNAHRAPDTHPARDEAAKEAS